MYYTDEAEGMKGATLEGNYVLSYFVMCKNDTDCKNVLAHFYINTLSLVFLEVARRENYSLEAPTLHLPLSNLKISDGMTME